MASISFACKVKKIGVAVPVFCANDAKVVSSTRQGGNRREAVGIYPVKTLATQYGATQKAGCIAVWIK